MEDIPWSSPQTGQRRLSHLLRRLLPALLLLNLWVPAGFAADIRVTTTADRLTPAFATFDPATNICGAVVDPTAFPAAPSLREALIYANHTPGPDTITFAPSLRGQTIRLSFDGPDAGGETDVLPVLCSGNTRLDGDVNGDGQPDITLDGSNFSPHDTFGRTWGVYVISANNTVSGLTLRNFPNFGIAVLHYTGLGTAPLTGTRLTNNTVVGSRLSIVVQAGLDDQAGTVRDTAISGNTVSAATSHGIYVLTGPVSGSTVDGTRITENMVSHTARFGIILQANYTTGGSNLHITNTTIQHNEVFANGATGLVAQSHGAANSRLTNLHILDNHIHDHADGYGIAVTGGVCGATGSTLEAEIARNTLSGNGNGIAATGGSNSLCLSEGSLAAASHNHLTVRITDNTLEDELGSGILIVGGSIGGSDNRVDATVTGNTVLRSGGGSGIGVIGGWATAGDESGAADRNTVSATLTHNRVEGAAEYGLGLAAGFSGAASANTVEVDVRHNTFVRNGHADISGQGGWTGDALRPLNTGTGNRLIGALADNTAATVRVQDGRAGNTATVAEREPQAPFRGTLENPQPGSSQSGIGIISGWVCAAQTIEIVFNDGPPVQAAYGTSRGDTRAVCGDSDNGFGLLFNWNLLGDGSHTVRALADGVEFASARVTVTTLGEEFVRGAVGDVTVPDFPNAGTDVVLRWQEAQQNFVLTTGRPARSGGTGGRPPRVLESPPPGSFQSGIGIISGWVCDARRIEITFDGGSPVEAAYGTSRGDTRGACGDSDNGFGLPFNWNLLGDGLHTVRALADGVEFAHATVTVTTLGEEFVRDAAGEVAVPDFPEDGTDVVLRWQEAQQNFVITAATSNPGDDPDGNTPHGAEWTNSIGMEFVRIEPGTFMMGVPEGAEIYDGQRTVFIRDLRRKEEILQHHVTLSQPFYLGKYEVTQAQWEIVMGEDPSFWGEIPGVDVDACYGHGRCPVESFSFEEMQDFITRLNAREGGQRYRLPTEAEWEYAARAGTQTLYPWGDDPQLICDYANVFGPYDNPCFDVDQYEWETTRPVGTFQPNRWGLYDMIGNVTEMVSDWFGPYPPGPVTDPQGATREESRTWVHGNNPGPRDGPAKPLRGCSYGGRVAQCMVGYRYRDSSPESGFRSEGLRLVRTIE